MGNGLRAKFFLKKFWQWVLQIDNHHKKIDQKLQHKL